MLFKKLSVIFFAISSLSLFSCEGLFIITGDDAGVVISGGNGDKIDSGAEGEDCNEDDQDGEIGKPQSQTSQQGEGDSLQGYFVRPASKGEISIIPSVDSDIWYVFTNTTGRNIRKPTWYLSSVSSNLLSSNMTLSFRGSPDRISNEIKRIDSDLYLQYGSFEDCEQNGDSNHKAIVARGADVVGNVASFYDNDRLIEATCKLTRTVETAFGPRTLVIYEENGMVSKKNGIPTDEEYVKIADAFLKDGLDNDIFDKLTGIFGCDWGKYNGSTNSNLIDKDDTITFLYCNINNQGDPTESYIGGYYMPLHYKKNDTKSNKRMMVILHAHTSGAENLGDGLTNIAHEFQHLLHDQYLNKNLYDWGKASFKENTSSITEMLSSLTETLTAQFISESCSVEVPGPFYVGYNRNPKGYVKVRDDNLTTEIIKNFTLHGRGPYFLESLDHKDVMSWSNQLSNYSLVASLGAYLLINYGTDIFIEYKNGDRGGILGIVDAINKVYPDADMTQSKLIANWGTAVMLSKVVGLDSPVAFNKEGWYIINGMKVPSIDFYNYFNRYAYPENKDNTAPFFAYNECYGIADRRLKEEGLGYSLYYQNRTINPYKVKGGVAAGTTFTATAPELPEGLVLTVVAVPK